MSMANVVVGVYAKRNAHALGNMPSTDSVAVAFQTWM
jgi:hypothetical protein